jgi:hypothetical protein
MCTCMCCWCHPRFEVCKVLISVGADHYWLFFGCWLVSPGGAVGTIGDRSGGGRCDLCGGRTGGAAAGGVGANPTPLAGGLEAVITLGGSQVIGESGISESQ